MGDNEKQLSLLSDEKSNAEERWTTRSGLLTDPPFDDGDDESNLPLVTAEWPDARTEREFEVDLSEVTKRTIPFARVTTVERSSGTESADIESHPAERPFVAEPIKPSPVVVPRKSSTETVREEPLERFLMEAKRVPPEVEKPLIRSKEHSAQLMKGAVLPFPANQRLGTAETAPLTNVESSRTFSSALSGVHFGRLRNLGIALSAPVGLGILLWIVGTFVTPITSSLLAIASSDIGRVAPEGLELQSLASQVRTLEDGREVVEITGTVLNSTPKQYRAPQIIARSFDNRNQKLSEVIFPALNGIQHVESLSSLRSEMVQTLQQEEGVMKSLKPGESVPFKVALLIDGEKPSYFDARVYSVRP